MQQNLHAHTLSEDISLFNMLKSLVCNNIYNIKNVIFILYVWYDMYYNTYNISL